MRAVRYFEEKVIFQVSARPAYRKYAGCTYINSSGYIGGKPPDGSTSYLVQQVGAGEVVGG